jgi:hypothetical protein
MSRRIEQLMSVALRRRSRRVPPGPRLLTKAEAAAYCGVSSPVFGALCPVRPIALGAGKRLERYDIQALDTWLDELSDGSQSGGIDWLSMMERGHGRGSR